MRSAPTRIFAYLPRFSGTDQRRFTEALTLLDRALAGYLQEAPEHHDRHLAGRILVKKAHVLTQMAESKRAILTLREAEGLVDPNRDPRLLLCLQHNLLDNLASAGRSAEARELLPEVEALCRSAGSRLDEIRLRWVAGRIAAGLGDRSGARRSFGDARREFAARGMAYDAALVSLELAVLLIEQGETAEVRELADKIAEIFRARDVHRETLAALAVFRAAAALDAATADLARDLAAYLTRARLDLELRFERER
jgi:tetratricopeptide (TPR) repeat protein